MFKLTDSVLESLTGEVLDVSLDPRHGLQLRLTAVVAVTNYKTLARLGHFDAKTKTASIPLLNMSQFQLQLFSTREDGVTKTEPYMMVRNRYPLGVPAESFASSDTYVDGDWDTISSLCKRLNHGKRKIFATVGDAFTSKRNRSAKKKVLQSNGLPADWQHRIRNPAREPEWMDMPMWSSEDRTWSDLEV
jgi:hypothetical protein